MKPGNDNFSTSSGKTCFVESLTFQAVTRRLNRVTVYGCITEGYGSLLLDLAFESFKKVVMSSSTRRRLEEALNAGKDIAKSISR